MSLRVRREPGKPTLGQLVDAYIELDDQSFEALAELLAKVDERVGELAARVAAVEDQRS